jgi:hypothetical protein
MNPSTVVRRSCGIVLVLGLAAILTAGCGSSDRVAYQPVALGLVVPAGPATDGNWPVPTSAPNLRVKVLGEGGLTPDAKGAATEMFRVRFAVTNEGSQPMTLDPAAAYLFDNDGTRLASGKTWTGDQKQGRVTVAPGKSGEFALAFDLSAKTPLKELKVLRVRWPYTYGGDSYVGGARFMKIETGPVDNSVYGNPSGPMSPYVGWSSEAMPSSPSYESGWGISGYGRRW